MTIDVKKDLVSAHQGNTTVADQVTRTKREPLTKKEADLLDKVALRKKPRLVRSASARPDDLSGALKHARSAAHTAVKDGSRAERKAYDFPFVPVDAHGFERIYTDTDRAIFNVFQSYAVAAKARGEEPTRIVMSTDHGKDTDDKIAVAIGAALQEMGLIEIRAAASTLTPAREHAEDLIGNLRYTGLHTRVPVGVGSKGSDGNHRVAQHEFNSRNRAPEQTVEQLPLPGGGEVLKAALQKLQAEGKKAKLVGISSVRDIVSLIESDPDLVKATVSEVHMQGGDKLIDGKLVPDVIATNNEMDMEAAGKLYKFLGETGIYSRSATKVAAYKVEYPIRSLQNMSLTDSKMAVSLAEDAQRTMWKFYIDAQVWNPDYKEPYMGLAGNIYVSLITKYKNVYKPGVKGILKPADMKSDVPTTPEELNALLSNVLCYDALSILSTLPDALLMDLGIFEFNSDAATKARMQQKHVTFGTEQVNNTGKIDPEFKGKHDSIGTPGKPGISGQRAVQILDSLIKRSVVNSLRLATEQGFDPYGSSTPQPELQARYAHFSGPQSFNLVEEGDRAKPLPNGGGYDFNEIGKAAREARLEANEARRKPNKG